ncbi:hypothetical protein [Mangrovihabitans endophyticus]|uniref:Uncharacterized protein n=1 Tax=Mangrovihabitans endophyticus TaxID=1751298 RepID=A0A8J3BUX0_9ACTN|nr:hypothetical protein [Mangrovihabitans endophyticus]GGK72093.1 hypothetical protein GCM10012284_02380 [Mangrovihabitans endophyticus]
MTAPHILDVPPAPERYDQHPTHLGLLAFDGPPTGTARVDAVVVPTSRRPDALLPALDLAERLGAPLVALCSQSSSPAAVVERCWQRPLRTTVLAALVDGGHRLPGFRANRKLAEFEASRPAAASLKRRADTSTKRNIGLALGRMAGWERVLFLDDDIAGVSADELRGAAALLDRYDAVCLRNDGFFDNSVVCHANRDTGGSQGTFVGAGALLVPATRTTSFFPDIYNEDWFFLLAGDRLADLAVTGSYRQARYDPYANHDRARQEEFGDCLAEGIFALLDEGRSVADADLAYWRGFLARRMELITDILRRLPTAPLAVPRRERMRAALHTSLRSVDQITPHLCVSYLRAWHRDRRNWADFLGGLPRGLPPDQALAHLGIKVWST